MSTAMEEVSTDYGWTDYETSNAIGVVRACFAAGRPDMIEQMLFDHVPAEAVPRLLTARAAAMAAVVGPSPAAAVTPAKPTALRPRVDAWSDVMTAAAERFRIQVQQAPRETL